MISRLQFLSILFVFIVHSATAQVPEAFNYQGVLRNSSGELIQEQNVSLRIAIIEGSITDPEVYSEIHDVTTNKYGVFSIQVGRGEVDYGSFSKVTWSSGQVFIKTEVNETGGEGFTNVGTVPLLSVPYALYANEVANKDDADADPSNEIQDISLNGDYLEITNGSIVDLSVLKDGVNDADSDSLNEIQDLDLTNNILTITNKTNPTEINLASYQGSNTDEQILSLNGTDLSISGGNTIDVSSLQDGVDDADNDPTNENQNLSLDGTNLSISNGNTIDLVTLQDGVDDADNNPTNEIQDISIEGTNLSISNGSAVDLSILQDGVDDADNDPMNEFQSLSLKGDTLSLSDGNQIILPDSTQWKMNNNDLYYNSGNVGVGTNNPVSKLEVRSEATSGALFQVINSNNDTVFAVYPDGVKVFVNPDAKGRIGGFAVSGRNPAKGGSVDIMRVTGDSTRIYVNENTAKGRIGGFAVSGRNPAKSGLKDYFVINEDSTRIYVKDSTSAKGKIGGFAVSGRNPAKSGETPFMKVNRYNYFIGHESGQKNNGGLHNSFLGYQSGYNNLTGSSNVFLGYQTGYGNQSGQNNNYIGYEVGLISQEGNYNNVIGYRAMLNDPDPNYNVIIGAEAARYAEHNFENIIIGSMAARNTKNNGSSIIMGSSTAQMVDYLNHSIILGNYAAAFSDTSEKDIFIGEHAGGNLKNSLMNVFIGHNTGRNMTEGEFNVMIGGYNAYHYQDNKGSFNTIMGYQAGNKCNGDGNVFIGYKAGYSETGSNKLYISNTTTSNPLIKGDFATGKTTLNNILNLGALTDYPANPTEGDMVRLKGHSTDNDGVYIYNGTSWVAMVSW